MAWAGLVACLAGCEPPKSPKKTGPPPPTAPAVPLPTIPKFTGPGSIELVMASPVKTNGCYASLIAPPSGRRRVLQINSYQDMAQEVFPSVFFRAEVSADSAAALVGQTIKAQLFVQRRRDGPVWYCPPDQPVELTVTAAESGGTIEGQVVAGRLITTETGQVVDVTGKFHGSLR